MTELDLFKWVQEWQPEWRWDTNGSSNEDDVIIWLSIYSLESFQKLLPAGSFDDGGIEARLQDRHVVIWARDICDYSGIKIENVFPKDNQ